MPDQNLTMRAGVVDNASPALRLIQQNLRNLSRSGDMSAINVGLRQTQAVVSALGRELRHVAVPAMAGLGLAGGGVIATFVGMTAALRNYAKTASELRAVGRETGFTTGTIREFEAVTKRMGLAPEAARGGLQAFSKNLFEIRNRSSELYRELKQLGAGEFADDLFNASRSGDYEAALRRTITALQALAQEDPQKAALLSEKMFGTRDLARLENYNRVLREIPDSIRQGFAKGAPEVERFNILLANLDDHLKSLRSGILRESLPIFEKLIDFAGKWTADNARPVGTAIANSIREISEIVSKIDFANVATAIGAVGREMAYVVKGVDNLVTGFKYLAGGIEKVTSGLEYMVRLRAQVFGTAVGPGAIGVDPVAELASKREHLDALDRAGPLAPGEAAERKLLQEEIDRLEKLVAAGMRGTGEVASKLFGDGVKRATPDLEKKGKEGGEAAAEGFVDGVKRWFRRQSFDGAGPGGGTDGQFMRASLSPSGGSASSPYAGFRPGFRGGMGSAIGGAQNFSGVQNPATGSSGGPAGGAPSYDGSRTPNFAGVQNPAGGNAGATSSGNVKSWMEFFQRPREEGGAGYTRAQAAGAVGNLQKESSKNIVPWGLVGDRHIPGGSHGAAQWNRERVASLKRKSAEWGMDHRTTEAQQRFVRHELDTTHRAADRAMRAAQTPEEAATAWNRKYEVSADGSGERERNARRLFNAPEQGEAATGQKQTFERVGGTPFSVPKGDPNQTYNVQAPGGGRYREAGNFVRRGADNVDPRLRHMLREAALRGGYDVEAFSGFRPGSSGQHGSGNAIDFQLRDANGKLIPNYQNEAGFRAYEKFAQDIKRVQQEMHPELNKKLRWGGYFSGGRGRYGANDAMHIDLGDERNMGGGSWAGGMTPAQRRLWPGAQSIGMGANYADQRLSRFLAGRDAPNMSINGSADIRVNVNAPRGTQVDATSGGIFKPVEMTRSMQMTPAAAGPEFTGVGAQPY